MASNKNLLHKICMLKPMQFLGKISYSIYMVHYLLIMCFALPIIDQIGFHYTGPGSVSPPLIQGLFLCILSILSHIQIH
jgi:peptidoglycan/LPS O-acetylase OafA/YrhL